MGQFDKQIAAKGLVTRACLYAIQGVLEARNSD